MGFLIIPFLYGDILFTLLALRLSTGKALNNSDDKLHDALQENRKQVKFGLFSENYEG